METVVQLLVKAFPDYSISANQRPDGLLLHFASNDKQAIEFRRVLPTAIQGGAEMDRFILEVRRELALRRGDVPTSESLRRLRDQGLPSYD